MAIDAETAERNALLDELTAALETWYAKEERAIQTELGFLRSVVSARSSAAGAAKSNTVAARVLVIDDITSFLAGV